MSCYFLNNYQRAFGTWPLKNRKLSDALQCAIESGYRAIDTAQMYQNESETGACVAASGVPRDEFLITTKVKPANLEQAQFLPSVEQSLKDLQLDQVDVLLLHWPPANGDIKQSIKLLNEAATEGLAKHIGLSNFTSQMMRDARHLSDHPLVTNQVEFHPLLNQSTLLATAAETDIPLSSYCSVARGEVFKQPLIQEMAIKYQKEPGQIVLRWILQLGVSVNTMSTNPTNIKNNYDVMNFTLSSVDMTKLQALTKQNHRIVNKSVVPWAPEWD